KGRYSDEDSRRTVSPDRPLVTAVILTASPFPPYSTFRFFRRLCSKNNWRNRQGVMCREFLVRQ
ncbi:MAG: hypothetical protein ABI988_16830, partial [Nitrospirota bacterium]